jgi:hypothetical protein
MSRVHIDDPGERQRWIEGRRERLETAREAGFRDVSWLSVFAGVAAALGAAALYVASRPRCCTSSASMPAT